MNEASKEVFVQTLTYNAQDEKLFFFPKFGVGEANFSIKCIIGLHTMFHSQFGLKFLYVFSFSFKDFTKWDFKH